MRSRRSYSPRQKFYHIVRLQPLGGVAGLLGTVVISNWLCFKSNSSRGVAMATNFGKIGKMTFITQVGVSK